VNAINLSCTQQSQCTPFGAAFCPEEQPRRCQCHEYARYNESTQFCEMKEGLGAFCEESEQCKVSNTLCSPRSTCECKPNYVAQVETDECRPGDGGDCKETEDCAIANAECKVEVVDEKNEEVPKKCRCKDDFVGIGNECFEKGEPRQS
jgi:hypothetical protein